MSGGHPLDGRESRNLYGSVATDLRFSHMKKYLTVRVEIRIDLAMTLWAIAWFVSFFAT